MPTLTVENDVAMIRLHRPEVHNRIETVDLRVLTSLFEQIDASPALRAAVLTASGRSFSSGFHIGELGEGEDTGEATFGMVVDRLEALRVPTVCGLNGSVYGGSIDLALACDFRIGVTGMEMFMPAARNGLHYYPSGLGRYVSRMGLNAAKRLFLTAEKLEAEELLRIGFLTNLVAPETLAARVQGLVADLASYAPLAVQGMKVALNAIARGDADFDQIEARAARLRYSEDFREGRRAWLERRPPRFTGT